MNGTVRKHWGPVIGLVVEGATEYQILPEMLARLEIRCTRPSCFNGQPVEASIQILVEHCLLPHVKAQLAKKADLVLVVLDAEQRTCPVHDFEERLRRELRRQVRIAAGASAQRKVEVIVCNRTFENWLLADAKGILRSEYIQRDLSRKVDCHADSKDALSILREAFRKRTSYRKAVHGPKLAKCIRVGHKKVRLCSESLRAFLQTARAPSQEAETD